MINRKVLEDLLQKPLGPYHDRDVLHETACQMKGGSQLVLYSFVLEHDGHVTGYSYDSTYSVRLSNSDDVFFSLSLLSLFSFSLNESERPLPEGRDDRKFRFRGILKIADPDWLSDFGLKTVETELNLRANERALREGERRLPPLTLEGLFESRSRLLTRSDDSTWRKEEGAKLTVLIQGEKSVPASYMQCTLCPHL